MVSKTKLLVFFLWPFVKLFRNGMRTGQWPFLFVSPLRPSMPMGQWSDELWETVMDFLK